MNPFYMIELHPDWPALLRFLHDQRLEASQGDDDLGYGIHAWLLAAFGSLAPKPWRLFLDRRRPPRLLGYANHSAEELGYHLQEFADPSAYAACKEPKKQIVSRPMPVFKEGLHLSFELLGCPVGRKADSGVEKDLFLMHADKIESATLDRDRIYCEWAREHIEHEEAAKLLAVRLGGFRLTRQVRFTQKDLGLKERKKRALIRPWALFQGKISVLNSEKFAHLLRQGIGRHRSFGYGMLLLRPSL